MIVSSRLHRLFLTGLALLLLSASSLAQFANFVTRKGDRLYDGEKQVRFISVNTPNLHYLEDYLPFEATAPWRLPDEFEIRDALKTVGQLGGKVTRIYVPSVRREDDAPGVIRHVEGPGQFNEEAFRTLDKALQIANELGVRIIMPFVDNWRWWGGPREYAAFRGKPPEAFWTDPEIIADLKATIKYVINRRNTYTGVTYREDRAVFAWETGNELGAPYSWTKEIASYVKSLDTNHLLVDGTSVRTISEEALADSNIDIVTTHHYHNPAASLRSIVQNQALVRGRKPYVVGEYGIIPLQDLRALTDTIINQGLAGGMVWSLRFHNRDGGFYHHYEYGKAEAYRWPGFVNGDAYDERMALGFLRDRAFRIDGELPPRLPVPDPPVLLPIADPAHISWQGSTGAESYRVERREEGDPDWQAVATGVDESRVECRPLFDDESAVPGKRYSYQVKAVNESGTSGPSNVVGPVDVNARVLVDEMEDFSRIFQKDGELRLLTFEDLRRAKEDRSRLAGPNGSYVMYKLPGAVSGVRIEWLSPGADAGVELFVSGDLMQFQEVQAGRQLFHFQNNDYGFYDAVVSSTDALPAGTLYVKVVLRGSVQIGRVEVTYGGIGKK